jgi:dUTP pyrophosphatase
LNNSLVLKILPIEHDDVKTSVPKRATEGSAGFDLTAAISEPITINPNALSKIPTGIAIELPSVQYVALVFARSGIAVKYGIALSNGVGVIDSDYRGEIQVGLCNVSNEPYTIEPGERIAQLVVMPVCIPAIEVVKNLDQTQRGAGGFGSTGEK